MPTNWHQYIVTANKYNCKQYNTNHNTNHKSCASIFDAHFIWYFIYTYTSNWHNQLQHVGKQSTFEILEYLHSYSCCHSFVTCIPKHYFNWILFDVSIFRDWVCSRRAIAYRVCNVAKCNKKKIIQMYANPTFTPSIHVFFCIYFY